MKTLTAGLAVAVLMSAPALAQDLEAYTPEQVAEAAAMIEAAGLTDTAYQTLWCGSAFLVLNQLAASRGMAPEAEQALAAADVLFGKAASEAVAAGVPEADFTAVSQSFRITVIAQSGPDGEADYTQEECVAAAQVP